MKVATVPPNYADTNQYTDLANLGFDNVAYTDPTFYNTGQNQSFSIRNSNVDITTDGNAGDDISLVGNPFVNNRSNGLRTGRTGKKNSRYVFSVGASKNLLEGTYVSPGEAKGWQHFVTGLCWNWSSAGAHSASKCSYPTRCVLLYCTPLGTPWRIEATQKVFGQSLGAPGNSQSVDYWTCYQVEQQYAYMIKDNDLYWGGFAFEMYANHGTGNQSLLSSIWNVRPTFYKGGLWDVGTSFASSNARQVILNKNNSLNQASSTSSSRAKQLQVI